MAGLGLSTTRTPQATVAEHALDHNIAHEFLDKFDQALPQAGDGWIYDPTSGMWEPGPPIKGTYLPNLPGDGTTNVTTEIDNAIDAVPAVGGAVFIPPGTHIVSAAVLSLLSNLTIFGLGPQISILKLANNANGRMISWSTAISNVTFMNVGFDFNKDNQTNGTNRDDRSGFQLTNVNNLRLLNCRIYNCKSGAALRLFACENTLLLGNRFQDNGSYTTTTGSHTLPVGTINVASTAGFLSSGSINVGGNQTVTYTGITGTSFTGCTGGTTTIAAGSAIIQISTNGSLMLADHNFNGNADHLRVIGNSYDNATDTGTAQDGIQHSTVSANTYTNNTLAVSISNSSSRNSRWNTIGHNAIKGGSGLFRTSVGIKVSSFGNPSPGNMTDGVIGGNVVRECDRALWFEEMDRGVVSGNIFEDTPTDAPNKQLVLLSTTGTLNDCRIVNNLIAGTTNRGFSFSSGAINNLELEGNKFVSVTTPLGGTVPTSAAVAKVKNNSGYNPLGPVAAAAAGASPHTHTAGIVPEWAYVTGGTVSGITKNGIAMPLGVPYFLEPGQSIIITHTGAPNITRDRL